LSHHSLVRTLYLYLFSLLGLILLTIGGVGFVNMALRALIFTHADKERLLYQDRIPFPTGMRSLEKLDQSVELTGEERALLKQMLSDYESREERRKKIDPVKARRHRDAAQNLSLIIIGFPLYLYHWRKVRSETEHSKSEKERD